MNAPAGTVLRQDDDQIRQLMTEQEIATEVTAGSDVAVCHSLNRLSTTPHGAAGRFDLWFRATVGLRKIDGRWLVIHEHNSTPFSMDGSFRAAVDLAP